jgi:hypothetical protein
MALIERLRREPEETREAPAVAAVPNFEPLNSKDIAYQELKSQVHNRLFEILDVSKMS